MPSPPPHKKMKKLITLIIVVTFTFNSIDLSAPKAHPPLAETNYALRPMAAAQSRKPLPIDLHANQPIALTAKQCARPIKLDDEGHITEVLRMGIPFNHYTTIVLYDPDFGFYTKEVNLGMEYGTCALVLAPVYGEMLAEHFFQMWKGMIEAGDIDTNEVFHIVECGAGTGVTAHDILFYISEKAKESDEWAMLYKQLKYVIFEISPKHVREQEEKTEVFADKIEIRNEDALNIEESLGRDSIKGIVFSDELIDNMEPHALRFNKDGSIDVGIAVMALNMDMVAKTTENMGVDILTALQEAGIISVQEIFEKDELFKQRLGIVSDDAVFIEKEVFLAAKKALSVDSSAAEAFQLIFNTSVTGFMFYIPIQYARNEKLARHINDNIDELALAVARSDEDIEIFLIPAGDRFVEAASNILKKGYLLTMDTFGESLAEEFRLGGRNMATFSSDSIAYIHPLLLPGKLDISVGPVFTTLSNAGTKTSLATVSYGPKSSLEEGNPINITTGEHDQRIEWAFMLFAIEKVMAEENLRRRGAPEEAIPMLEDAIIKVLETSSFENIEAPRQLIELARTIITKCIRKSQEQVAVWKKRFAGNFKILLQKKEGTGADYSIGGMEKGLFEDFTGLSGSEQAEWLAIRENMLNAVSLGNAKVILPEKTDIAERAAAGVEDPTRALTALIRPLLSTETAIAAAA